MTHIASWGSCSRLGLMGLGVAHSWRLSCMVAVALAVAGKGPHVLSGHGRGERGGLEAFDVLLARLDVGLELVDVGLGGERRVGVGGDLVAALAEFVEDARGEWIELENAGDATTPAGFRLALPGGDTIAVPGGKIGRWNVYLLSEVRAWAESSDRTA